VIAEWHRWEDLVTYHKLVVFDRPNGPKRMSPIERKYWATTHRYIVPNPPIPDTSSTTARFMFVMMRVDLARRLNELGMTLGEVYAKDNLSGQVDRGVFDYVVAKDLYVRKG
jgi:hypothetical protein